MDTPVLADAHRLSIHPLLGPNNANSHTEVFSHLRELHH